MSNDYDNFLSSYQTKLIEKKNEVQKALKEYEIKERELFDLQKKYANLYQIRIVKKFMNLWLTNNKFPNDEELIKVIFYIVLLF